MTIGSRSVLLLGVPGESYAQIGKARSIKSLDQVYVATNSVRLSLYWKRLWDINKHPSCPKVIIDFPKTSEQFFLHAS
jgi:hypothetical protein